MLSYPYEPMNRQTVFMFLILNCFFYFFFLLLACQVLSLH